ncbi:MAG: RNase P subunit p30 family protein [Candidatus Helarchaeales archaeon]
MKAYCDLHVHQGIFQDREDPMETIRLLERFGFSHVAIVKEKKNLEPLFDKLASMPTKIRFYKRLNLNVNSIKNLKDILKKQRQNFDLIGVRSANKSVFNFAIQDSRVDLLILGVSNKQQQALSFESAKMLRKFQKPVEIQIRDLIFKSGSSRSRILRVLKKSTENIIRARCPFVVSSNAHSYFELRAPRDMAFLLTLVDFPVEIIVKGVLEHPLACLENSRDRKDPKVLSKDLQILEE